MRHVTVQYILGAGSAQADAGRRALDAWFPLGSTEESMVYTDMRRPCIARFPEEVAEQVACVRPDILILLPWTGKDTSVTWCWAEMLTAIEEEIDYAPLVALLCQDPIPAGLHARVFRQKFVVRTGGLIITPSSASHALFGDNGLIARVRAKRRGN